MMTMCFVIVVVKPLHIKMNISYKSFILIRAKA